MEVIDKRLPPRSSASAERRLRHLGLRRSRNAGERRMPPAGSSLQAVFDCVHARLQHLQVDSQVLASSASSRARHPFVNACRALASSAWLINRPAWSASACCSDRPRTRPSALTCASFAVLWVCSASRDRPTLLMSATALMSNSQKAAEILSQRVRESRSDGARERSWLHLLGPVGVRRGRGGAGRVGGKEGGNTVPAEADLAGHGHRPAAPRQGRQASVSKASRAASADPGAGVRRARKQQIKKTRGGLRRMRSQ